MMFKRQASVTDAQQATSLTYILKAFNQYQHEPCHCMKSEHILTI